MFIYTSTDTINRQTTDSWTQPDTITNVNVVTIAGKTWYRHGRIHGQRHERRHRLGDGQVHSLRK